MTTLLYYHFMIVMLPGLHGCGSVCQVAVKTEIAANAAPCLMQVMPYAQLELLKQTPIHEKLRH